MSNIIWQQINLLLFYLVSPAAWPHFSPRACWPPVAASAASKEWLQMMMKDVQLDIMLMSMAQLYIQMLSLSWTASPDLWHIVLHLIT